HRRGDSYAAAGLALGLSAWAHFGIDSGSRSISHLDSRGFLRDQPQSSARSRVEIVELFAVRTSAWPRVGSHVWSRLARRRRWHRRLPSGYYGRAWRDPD